MGALKQWAKPFTQPVKSFCVFGWMWRAAKRSMMSGLLAIYCGDAMVLKLKPSKQRRYAERFWGAPSLALFAALFSTLILSGCQLSTVPATNPTDETVLSEPSDEPNSAATETSNDEDTGAATGTETTTKASTAHRVKTTKAQQTDTIAVDYSDLWHKIADARSIDIPPHKEVDYYRSQFASRALFPANATRAASPWMFHVVNELEARDMPLELALLPLVESGFQPGVKGIGGAGLWQLSAQTARGLKLRVNKEYDGRLDPIPATRTALDYLLYLYEMFDNDWLSAVAAYNMGEGKLKSAIARNRRQGKPEDFLSLGMSRNQAPSLYKWLAVIEIARDPAALEMNFPVIANTQVLGREGVPNGVSLSSVAKAIALPKAELLALNPAFKTQVVPSSGKYMINLPLEQIGAFELARAQLKREPTAVGKGGSYVVKSGDTLSGIAKRQGVKLSSLMQVNGLNNKSIIRPGQKLAIPGA